jgi:serine protease Do
MASALNRRMNITHTNRRWTLLVLLIATLALTLMSCPPLGSTAATPIGGPMATDLFRTIAQRQNPMVVAIMTTSRTTARTLEQEFRESILGYRSEPGSRIERGLGSGFIISGSGEILTNDHVVAGAEAIEVALYGSDTSRYRATLIGRDPLTDSALIRLEQPPPGLPVATFGDSDTIAPGDWVMAIGNPFELGHTVTVGVVSYQGRAFEIDAGRWQKMIQTDASINPGNSGGPLLNVRGEVVGINTAMLDDDAGGISGIGFAVPINTVTALLPQLRRGKVIRGHLGVHVHSRALTAKDAAALGLPSAAGAIVSGVERDGPAQRAGLGAGDVITAIDGQPVADGEDFVRQMSCLLPGARATLTILRDGRSDDVPVTLDEMRLADDQPQSSTPAPPDDIGARFTDVSSPRARQLSLPPGLTGAVVFDVVPDTEAEFAGLRRGDVVQRVNRQPIRTAVEAAHALAAVGVGEPVFVLVWRAGDQQLLRLRE